MIKTFDQAVELVLNHEGGYINDPDDPGGETKFGISKRAYPQVDIKNLTLDGAKDIYKLDYWDRSKAQALPPGVRYIHFDTAVNMGHNTAAKLLQRAAGVDDDGIIGPKTMAAAENVSVDDYARARLRYYSKIVAKRSSSLKYLRGWLNRVLDIVELSK